MTSSLLDAESPSQVARLIVAARDGSAEALGRLMQFSRQYLLVIANDELPAELQAKGGASDLVQETQMEAVRGFGVFRGHTAAELLGWLREILLHNVRDFTRHYYGVAKRQVNREVPLADAVTAAKAEWLLSKQPSPSSHLQQKEQELRVTKALEQLGEDYRQVVVWHHRDGLSFEEISERLDRSVGAVRKLWARAIQQLQERLRPESNQGSRG